MLCRVTLVALVWSGPPTVVDDAPLPAASPPEQTRPEAPEDPWADALDAGEGDGADAASDGTSSEKNPDAEREGTAAGDPPPQVPRFDGASEEDDQAGAQPEGPPVEIPIDRDLFEEYDPQGGASGRARRQTRTPEMEVRRVRVSTDALGVSSAHAAYMHAGARQVIEAEHLRERGVAGINEAFSKIPGVRATDGVSGLGSSDTKLNLAVRGVNPSLSWRSAVLLDEVPIAPAPYGQPQMSLFPLSLFSIAKIDAIRGGATLRFGPQTVGGVFNLVSNPIPTTTRIAAYGQYDSNQDTQLGASFGTTYRRLGMYVEYAPRFGSSWRDHSDRQIHGGLIKFSVQTSKRSELLSTTHLYSERSELPGGLNRIEYQADPFQSRRPFDRFDGNRIGTSLKFKWQPNKNHEFSAISYYMHTYRTSIIASNKGDSPSDIDQFVEQPRIYDVTALEPRYTWRANAKSRPIYNDLNIGIRGALELANLSQFTRDAGGRIQTVDDDGRLGAIAGYIEDQLHLLDDRLVIGGGIRFEGVVASRRANLERNVLTRSYYEPLPAVSMWFSPVEGFALFADYAHSFGPPQFLQLSAANSQVQLRRVERAESVEGGFKIEELGGMYVEASAWYKYFDRLIDVGEDAFENIGNSHAWGVEVDASWDAGEVVDKLAGFEIYGGYAWTASRMLSGMFKGNKLAWYPAHETWAGLSYATNFGIKFGFDAEYTGFEYSDYANRLFEDPDTAQYGRIPDYLLLNLWARYNAAVTDSLRLEIGAGIKNLLDQRWISRTDDRNAGILAQRPRTFYVNLGLAYDFLPPAERRQAQARRKARRNARKGIIQIP